MNNKSINIKRTQSLLMELIPEALSSLNDSRIKSLSITEVDCKNGKYDARIYFDASDYNNAEIKEIRLLLRKASGRIKSHCLNATGWYKCPDLTFIQDDMLEKKSRIEDLFAQISPKKVKK
jgi:ribosome-binding factor A